MPTTDFERNDALDSLTSEELEEQAFGPDPSVRRPKKKRLRRRKKTTTDAPPALLARPAPAPPTPTTKFCYACGGEVDARAEVCRFCGVRQPEVPSLRGERDAKSKGAATLLALFLGGVGAHRFYLGQTKLGLVMLLFCWTMIPFAAGVVDALRYVFMSDRRFAALYGPEPAALLVPPRPVRRLGRGADPAREAVESPGPLP